VDPPKRKRTKTAEKAAAPSVSVTISEKPSRKRKVPQFSASIPRRRTRSSAAVKSPDPVFPISPPITLRPRTPPSPEHSPPSPSGAEMQGVHDFVTSFLQAAATQKPAVDTQGNTGQQNVPQQTTFTPPVVTKEFSAQGGDK